MIPGEAERLLQEYRQNQELVQNIGAHYYQIIYPVQLRHHEKMGISTREVSVSKVIKLFLRTISNERKSIRNFSFIENWYILWCRNFVTFSRSKAYRIFFFYRESINFTASKLFDDSKVLLWILLPFLTIESLSNFLYRIDISIDIFRNRETLERLKAYRIFFIENR